MNNGICSINLPAPYQTDYLSNYNSSNLVRYSQLELSIPQRLFGNSTSIPSIYGLPINTNSSLDFENSLIYIVDTSVDPVVQTPASTALYAARSTLVQIPTTQFPNRLIIDWGDGSIETYQSNPIIASHRYNLHGIYYVQVKFNSSVNNNDYYPPVNYPACNGRDGKIIGILSFGNKISSFTLQFFVNVWTVPKTVPKNITRLTMFQMAGPIGSNISDWDISNLTTKLSIGSFLFNQDVSKWKFNAAITDFSSLFNGCALFNNGDEYTRSSSLTVPIPAFPAGNRMNIWNTSDITNMSSMFYNCYYFNQNLNNWNVSKVTNFSSMFSHDHNTFYSFDGDLSNWQLIASGVNCSNMFAPAGTNRGQLFTGKGLDSWNTSGVTNMTNMLAGNTLFNQNLGSWDTSKVTSMAGMFNSCLNFAGSGLNNWNTTNVTNMSNMFVNTTSFNQPLNNWNVRKVTNFSSMFQGATSFNSSLSGWALGADTAATSCASMLADCPNFNQDIGNWDVSKVTNMSYMFSRTSAFAVGFNNGNTPSISGWDTSNVTNMSFMFANITGFNQPTGPWNVSKVTTMNGMFQNATSFNQDISSWNLAGLNINTGLDGFMTGKTGTAALSTFNYDSLLIGWNNNKLATANGVANWRTDLRPNFGGAKYTSGGAAATARAALVSYGWTITDGGAV